MPVRGKLGSTAPWRLLLKKHWIGHLATLLVMFSFSVTVFIMPLPFADSYGGSKLTLKLNSISWSWVVRFSTSSFTIYLKVSIFYSVLCTALWHYKPNYFSEFSFSCLWVFIFLGKYSPPNLLCPLIFFFWRRWPLKHICKFFTNQ